MTSTSGIEEGLIYEIVAQLRERLPSEWQVRLEPWREVPGLVGLPVPDFDLIIAVPGNRRPARLAVEVKVSSTPREAYSAASGLSYLVGGRNPQLFEPPEGQRPDGILLASYFFSPRARDLLRDAGFFYADTTGNVRIVLKNPPLFIDATGLDKLPQRTEYAVSEPRFLRISEAPLVYSAEPRLLQSLKGPGAALGVRALVDFPPPYGLRELSERARVSLGTLSRVLEFVEGELLIERQPRGPVERVDWEQLLRRWAQDYSLLNSNATRTLLAARGIDDLVERLRGYNGKYAVTGSLAAATVAPEAPSALAAIYVDSFEAASTLGLRETASGGNVLLIQPFPSARGTQALAPFLRTRRIEGVTYVAVAQAVVDLLTSPGRGPAEAEALIAWMKSNENVWRP